ncbi:D-Ala-D-Ala carboxypeptidase family metallohydrolase [Xanthomonas sacchari]
MFGPLDAINYVQQQGEIGRARGQQNQLAQLASQAYTAAPSQQNQLLGQIAAISPQAAEAQQQQFQKQETYDQGQEDRRMQKLAGAARYLQQAKQSGDPAAIQGAWNAVRPMLQREIPNGQFAEQWDDATMTPVLYQVLAQTGGSAQGQVQSTYVDAQGNRVAIMRNGSTQVLGQDNPKIQIIDAGDGYYGVDRRNLTATPVNTGASGMASGAAGGAASTGNRAADFTGLAMEFPGVKMTSGTRTAQRNAEVGGQPNSQHLAGTAADYAVPDALKPAFVARARQLGYQPIDEGDHVHLQLPNGGAAAGGTQLRKAPTQITPYQQQQLELEREAAAKRGIPAGYQQLPDGTLRAIPGGPADKPTVAEKPMPAGAIKQVFDLQDQLQGSENVMAMTKKHLARLDAGQLDVRPGAAAEGFLRNKAGLSDENSRNLAEWQADKMDLVNESLRLNKGVQTEGDANRAIQALMEASDAASLKQSMERLQGINQRAIDLRQRQITALYRNYGRGPDGEALEVAPRAPAPAPAAAARGAAGAGRTIVRSGTLPDGRKVVQYSDGTTDYGN